MVGTSLFFGATRHIRVPSSLDLEPGSGSFTVDFWMAWGGGAGLIVSKFDPAAQAGWRIWITAQGIVTFEAGPQPNSPT
ncbi:MAG: hypothetical protein D6723_01030, partial [Acidobacteria bacterium]